MESTVHFIGNVFLQSWDLLLKASFYVLLGILVGGLVKVFLSPAIVVNHLGRDRPEIHPVHLSPGVIKTKYSQHYPAIYHADITKASHDDIDKKRRYRFQYRLLECN